MSNDNLQKKKQVDTILATYNSRMAIVKLKRDNIISNYLEVLKEKKLDELRNSLNKV